MDRNETLLKLRLSCLCATLVFFLLSLSVFFARAPFLHLLHLQAGNSVELHFKGSVKCDSAVHRSVSVRGFIEHRAPEFTTRSERSPSIRVHNTVRTITEHQGSQHGQNDHRASGFTTRSERSPSTRVHNTVRTITEHQGSQHGQNDYRAPGFTTRSERSPSTRVHNTVRTITEHQGSQHGQTHSSSHRVNRVFDEFKSNVKNQNSVKMTQSLPYI